LEILKKSTGIFAKTLLSKKKIQIDTTLFYGSPFIATANLFVIHQFWKIARNFNKSNGKVTTVFFLNRLWVLCGFYSVFIELSEEL
jgi:hypothetical protein